MTKKTNSGGVFGGAAGGGGRRPWLDDKASPFYGRFGAAVHALPRRRSGVLTTVRLLSGQLPGKGCCESVGAWALCDAQTAHSARAQAPQAQRHGIRR